MRARPADGFAAAVELRPRSAAAIAMALGLVAFRWPFAVVPGTFSSTETPPLMFGALLVPVLAVVFAEIADGGIGSAWIGMLAGLLPPLRGKAEIALLAAYGAVAGYLFGFLLNLSFWPFSLDPSSSIAYQPGLSFAEQWHRYLLFDATTSLGWDTGRAITNVIAIVIAGPAVLAAFRRAACRANLRPPVTFGPPESPETLGDARCGSPGPRRRSRNRPQCRTRASGRGR